MKRQAASLFGGISLNHAGQLRSRSGGDLRDLGRRGLDEADQLGAQFIERRQRGKSLDAIDVQDGCAHRTAENDELLVRLGEFDGNFRRRHRIAGCSDHSRPLQQGADGCDVGAFKSNFGETVLRNLHRGARLLHLLAQLLHLGNGEAGIVSDDRDAGGLEQTIQRFDRLFFCRSFHSKLSPVGGPYEQDHRVAPTVPLQPDPEAQASKDT